MGFFYAPPNIAGDAMTPHLHPNEKTIHQPQLEELGGWLVYTCPLCPAFSKAVHLESGEVQGDEPDDNVVHDTGHTLATAAHHHPGSHPTRPAYTRVARV